MAGTNILVRQKDLIAGSGISITPDTTSGNVTIAATNTAIDEARLLPTGGKNGNILEYQEGADRGNGNDVRLLLQSALTDSASGNAAPAAVTTQGVTLTGDNSLLFSGNDSHVTAVLATDEIFAADKEWTIDFWMKPIANSSEWNYILTENTGDWGSHSIGLTWNKSKSVLEQDTGGYVASVIKAPNWPNNSIACAVGEWHFVAVEKQKTSTGWSLNYYLNGAIWLQVAFTGEFVPFTSDNPFWFGGKTTDSGRWFKGEANKLRVTAGARYGGKAFAVPDRLIDYAAPAGQPVWIEGIDRSRLLPENPANGDIPCYSNEPPVGVNYNDANTVLLLQGSSDNTAAAPTSERLNGIVTGEFPVQEDGSILVNGTSNYITFNDADTRRVFSGEFTLETYIKTTQFTASGKRQDTNWCVVYRNGGSVTDYQWLLLSDFYADAGKFGIWPYPQMSGETFPKTLINAEFQHVAIDVYMVDGVRKFTMYRNGVPYHTGNYWSTTPADWSSSVSAAMRLFGEGTSGGDDYLSNASVMSLRVSNVARYKGVSFEPPTDGKYLNPPSGYWSKLNKAKLVQSVNGQLPDESGNVTVETGSTVDESRLLPENPANGDIPCFDATATIGGGNDANTRILLHFDADEIKDEAAGNAAPVTITKKTGTITVVEGGKWGKCAKYVTGSMTVATNLDELNANNWVVSGWFNPDENNHGVSYPTWLSMDDQNTHGFGFDSTGRYGESDGPLFYLDTPPASGTWHWLAIVKYSGGLRFYLNGAFLNEISAQQRANFCSTLAIGGFAGTYAAGSTERTFSGLVDEVRLQYIPDDEITQWTGTSIAVPDAPYSKPQTVGEWGKLNKSELVKSVNGQTPDSSGAVTIPAATASAAGLMAAADKAAIAGLTTHGIYPNALAKSGAVDFNEVIDHGFYFIGGDTPHLNYPETYQQNGGTLQVIRNGNYLTQTFIPLNINTVFIRTCVNALSDSSVRTFSAWRRALTAPDITESKARPGYFKLPGGTIVQWGKKTVITRDEENCYISFPIAFPTMFLSATAIASSGTLSATGVIVSLSEASTTSMTMVVKNHPNTGSPDLDQYIETYWFAVGF